MNWILIGHSPAVSPPYTVVALADFPFGTVYSECPQCHTAWDVPPAGLEYNVPICMNCAQPLTAADKRGS